MKLNYENNLKAIFTWMIVLITNIVECDNIIAGSDDLSILLPIMIIDSQREKANIYKDVEDMLKKEFENNSNINTVEVVNILFGISTYEKNPYYS